MKAVLLDIEGTVTDIRFVTETLFPYARARMGAFLDAHRSKPAVADALLRMRKEMDAPAATTADIAAELVRWIDEDRKQEPLKSLQGLIWKEGYEDGSLKAHLYPDVRPAFERWKQAGLTLAIFSSGSIAAQKLLFAHSVEGDLTGFLSAHFDLTTGSKKDAASYSAIAGALNLPPAEIRFYSDAPAEITAAHAAGMDAVLVERSGPIDAPGAPRRVPSFSDED